MPSNTVKSVVARFLRNKHRDEFMALNPWMDLPTAAVVYFRRHTAHKTSYASYQDLPRETYVINHEVTNKAAYYAELAAYNKAALAAERSHWYQIPVSQKQCTGIRPATLAKYTGIIADLSDQYLDIP